MKVTLNNIGKKYESREDFTLRHINLEIEDKDFCVILGPSGCGKTTLLRMIAGLNSITEGDLIFGEKRVNKLASKDRDIAMVFQSYALYPHMTVYDNMAFSLSMRKERKNIINERVNEAAKLLQIEKYLYSKPSDISGGQRQRVALGRAIVRKPSVFLMDEPLSNLDAKLREHMRVELVRIHKALGTTSIYVTHDQVEAMTMGTRIVVMKDGVIQQVDSPINIYNNPANLFVAGFIGSPQMNFLEGKIEKDGNNVFAVFGNNKITLPKPKADVLVKEGYVGKSVTFGIRPEHLSDNDELIAAHPGSIVKGHVEVIELMGSESYIYTKCGNSQMNVKVEGSTALKIGEVANLYLNTEKLHVFDKETELRIV